ncbi:hypothetical protein [Virgibacillus pantothenticus]|uniref:hypothetical protein n=1 Tax=Virgibacillus pantothenticus TaxID=1473 RepID=UPI0009855059|nr:hypothetical protein [Virgibacillus pantothenticus]
MRNVKDLAIVGFMFKLLNINNMNKARINKANVPIKNVKKGFFQMPFFKKDGNLLIIMVNRMYIVAVIIKVAVIKNKSL